MSVGLAFLSAALAGGAIASLVPEPGSGARPGRSGATVALASALAARMRAGPRAPRDLESRIAAAGAPGGLGPRELMALKLFSAPAAAVLALPVGALLPGRLGIAALAVAPAAGFLGPDLWLARRARRRAAEMRRELPAMLDLLRVSVQAGLSLGAAVGEVGRRASGPLASEWRTVGLEAELGVPLGRSLEGLVRRAPLPEVRALTNALERAARHGAPLSETLDAQARDAREGRRRRIQEEAARAAPKIQLVVALLLVPAVLLLVAAALAAALLSGGGPPL